MIYLPNSSLETGFSIIESLRESLHSHKFEYYSEPVSMSFGLVVSDGSREIDPIVSESDQYLYKAKTAGRNLTLCSLQNGLGN